MNPLTLTLCASGAQEGEPSYELYSKERAELLASLKRRAEKLHKALSELQGVTCNPLEGALYAMPRIRLPPGAIEVGVPGYWRGTSLFHRGAHVIFECA